MKKDFKKDNVAALQRAAGAVIDHNAELSAHIRRGVAIFTETPPISERLKCETNGAHKYIEDFATALKALPRGCAPVKRTMKKMRESCRELILALKEAEKLLPDAVPETDRREFLDNVELVATEEARFYNLVIGESGAPPGCGRVAYREHIDNSIDSIKKKFTQLNIAIQHIERDLRRKSDGGAPSGNATPKRKSRSGVTKADLNAAVKTILHGDDGNLPKPGPRLNKAKERQIAAAVDHKEKHRGCTFRNACIKSFARESDGYASALSMYESNRQRMDR